jgi:hypothetical protein
VTGWGRCGEGSPNDVPAHPFLLPPSAPRENESAMKENASRGWTGGRRRHSTNLFCGLTQEQLPGFLDRLRSMRKICCNQQLRCTHALN